MNDLRTAAQQVLEACEQRLPLKGQAAIIDELNNLRAALAQQAEPVEPVAWIESPHGAIRANPNYKFTFPSQLLQWQIPLYTAPPQQVAQQAEPLNLSDPAVRKRLATQWGYVPASAQAEPDLSRCPQCNGPADNGHDRSIPPNPYLCTKCMSEPAEPVAQQAKPVAGVVLNEEGRAALVEHGREEWHCAARNARRLYTAPPQQVAQQAEPLNLRDPAVQKRLATQWGYVPAAAQAEPVEPVAWVRLEAWKSGKDWPDDCFTALPAEGLTPVYTAPPQRKLVPLTEEEIDGLVIQHAGYGRDNFYAVARAVERAHGIKE